MEHLTFKRLDYEDKSLIESFFHTYKPSISEYTFTNLYVWRFSRIVEYAVCYDTLLIIAEFGGQRYFMPLIGPNVLQVYDILPSLCQEYGCSQIKLVPSKHIEIAEDLFRRQYSLISEDRDNFDYLYLRERLVQLSSRKLSNKRNFLKRFTQNYQYQMVPYSLDYYQMCMDLLNKWISGRSDDVSLQNEFVAIECLLREYEHLNAVGEVLIVDNRAAAFAFGEPLNDDTFVIHFEKADTDFVGAYQAVNHLYVKHAIPPEFTYVNREQDLGHLNIRQAKMSYYPDVFVEKYVISK